MPRHAGDVGAWLSHPQPKHVLQLHHRSCFERPLGLALLHWRVSIFYLFILCVHFPLFNSICSPGFVALRRCAFFRFCEFVCRVSHNSYVPSQQDVEVLAQVSFGVDASAFPHVARWLNHIASFSAAQRAAFSGAKKAAAPAAKAAAADDDDDMFGDVEDDEDAAHELEMAQKAAAALKDKKPKKEVIAKSNVMFDVKPFEAETDMAELEAAVRSITMDGLVWGGSKLAAVAYGVRKLVINTVIEDDKSTS